MTFGFAQRTGVNWLNWLADRSREDEVFRHDLDRWGPPADRDHQQAELRAAAARLIDARDPDDFLAEREQDAVAARRVPFLEIFAPMTAVVCVTDFPPRVAVVDDTVEITAAGKRLTLTTRALPAARRLLSGHPVRLDGDTPADDPTRRLAEILTREGLCATLTPELSSGYTDLVTDAP